MMSEIKVTGSPMTYGDGATRNTKEGKGRFDLIPPEPMEIIDKRFGEICSVEHFEYCNDEMDIYRRAMRIHKSFGVLPQECDNIADIIISIIIYSHNKTAGVYWDEQAFFNEFTKSFMPTMKELAVHFENGAKIYGEHNCEKGIPKWSFIDSGLRHLTQFLNGEDDENHYIAAIWNFWMLLWTVIKEKSETESNELFDKLKKQIEKFTNVDEVSTVPYLLQQVNPNTSESEGDDNE